MEIINIRENFLKIIGKNKNKTYWIIFEIKKFTTIQLDQEKRGKMKINKTLNERQGITTNPMAVYDN